MDFKKCGRRIFAVYRFAGIIFAVILSGCSPVTTGHDGIGLLGSFGGQVLPATSRSLALNPIARSQESHIRRPVVEMGTGQFVNMIDRDATAEGSDEPTVSLNFVDTDVQEFVRVVFDQVLKEPIVIDASLKGKITLRTPAPVTRKAALELVKQALNASGASLVQAGNTYRVVSRTDQKANSRRLGDSLRIVPLTFISAEEAKAALGTLAAPGVEISVGPSSQYIVLSGSSTDLDNIQEVLSVLDVDQMKGMSFGLFPLKEANSVAVANELNQMFRKGGEARDFRCLSISRMNAVLIISHRPSMMTAARRWITRLDRSDGDQRKIYVYPVQNRRATEIAKLLSDVLQVKKQARAAAEDIKVAPSLTPTTMVDRQPRAMPNDSGPFSSGDSGQQPEKSLAEKSSNLRISADVSTNSIVVTASVEEWRIISSALRRLDVMAPQVLIEATIAEVRLNSALQHGVRWYFEKGFHGVGLKGDASGSLSPLNPGFNYTFGIPQARIVLNALEQVTDVEIISSPALTVLDNQTAKLQVGDQVPIATRSARSVVVPDAPTVNDIELKDTGVILSVTPRVNASGLVVLDITQEVSDVVPTTTSNLDSPTIRQRKVNSSIAVRSGKEIVLGGLIGVSRTKTGMGIPVLMDIPFLGEAFKARASNDSDRTELIVILRPTVMSSNSDIQAVTEEIKRRLLTLRRNG